MDAQNPFIDQLVNSFRTWREEQNGIKFLENVLSDRNIESLACFCWTCDTQLPNGKENRNQMYGVEMRHIGHINPHWWVKWWEREVIQPKSYGVNVLQKMLSYHTKYMCVPLRLAMRGQRCLRRFPHLNTRFIDFWGSTMVKKIVWLVRVASWQPNLIPNNSYTNNNWQVYIRIFLVGIHGNALITQMWQKNTLSGYKRNSVQV
jgi:hypothetical protein